MNIKTVTNNDSADTSLEAGGVRRRKTMVRFKTLLDVRRFLARVCNDLDRNNIGESKARTFGYLCAVMRDIIKDSDLETRVLRLEKELEKNKP